MKYSKRCDHENGKRVSDPKVELKYFVLVQRQTYTQIPHNRIHSSAAAPVVIAVILSEFKMVVVMTMMVVLVYMYMQ